MKIRISLLLLLCSLCFFDASAQRRLHRVNRIKQKAVSVSLDNYMDSLRIYKAKLDSMQCINDSLADAKSEVYDYRYYRLFSPLTFYPEVTGRKINAAVPKANTPYDQAIDNVLLHTYSHKPELVETTVKRLHRSAAAGDIVATKPVTHHMDIMKEVTPEKDAAPQQEDVALVVMKPNFWSFSGDYSLQFLQNYISENWYKGGESNLSMVGTVTMKLNYNNKKKVKFENTLDMKLGMQTSESDTLHAMKTSSDQLRYTGKLGLQASKRWYYTAQVIAKTQFLRGYKSNDERVYSDFLSPLEVNVSLGMDYTIDTKNKKLTGSLHLAPLAYNLKYVGRLSLSTRYGLEEGDHTLHDYGSQFTLNLTWKPAANIKWDSRLYAYTTYHRAEMEWENTISFALSKYISTKVYLFPRFDDSTKKTEGQSYWQFKEYFSLGFSYSL